MQKVRLMMINPVVFVFCSIWILISTIIVLDYLVQRKELHRVNKELKEYKDIITVEKLTIQLNGVKNNFKHIDIQDYEQLNHNIMQQNMLEAEIRKIKNNNKLRSFDNFDRVI